MAPAKETVQQHSTEDPESCTPPKENNNEHDSLECQRPSSTFKQLGLLDKLLALWIFLAMAIGIILGNFVPNTARALERGKFVGVSIPIGMSIYRKERR